MIIDEQKSLEEICDDIDILNGLDPEFRPRFKKRLEDKIDAHLHTFIYESRKCVNCGKTFFGKFGQIMMGRKLMSSSAEYCDDCNDKIDETLF